MSDVRGQVDGDDIRNNLNLSLSQSLLSDVNGPMRPIVCVLCDRFMVKDSNLILSLETLNEYQHLFYPDQNFELCKDAVSCYEISLPTGIPVSVAISQTLDIGKCILSPRAAYIWSGTGNDGFNICCECHNSISKGKLPSFCIANNFCFGNPPACLLDLSHVERALLTPVKTHGYCYCYTGGQKHKLVGSLSYYKINKKNVITAVGKLAAAGANVIVILHGQMTKEQLLVSKQKAYVSIDKLRIAVSWLLQYNSEWISLRWSTEKFEDYINQLKLQAPLVRDDNVDIVDSVDILTESEQILEVYFADGTINENTAGQNSMEELQQLVLDATTKKCTIAVRLDLAKEAVKDYKDGNFVNSCILQFPYGQGGMDVIRLTGKGVYNQTIELQKYLEYISMISQPHFQEGLFTLILYNMITKQHMFRSASWQVRNKIDSKMISRKLKSSDFNEAVNSKRTAGGIYTAEGQRGNQMLKAIDAVCNATPHSNVAAKKAKNKAQAMQHQFGCPTLFLTVTPDDDNNYSIQVLSGDLIDDVSSRVAETTDADLIARGKERVALRLKNPGICALFFEMVINSIITEILGWNVKEKKQEFMGLFGQLDAFTCSIEEQGRGTLHAHFLIWVTDMNKSRAKLHNANSSVGAEAKIKKFMDGISSTKCFFNNNIERDSSTSGVRKRFHHTCKNCNYGLPQYPDDIGLRKLRLYSRDDEFVIGCHHCDHKFSYPSSQDCHLKDWIQVPSFGSVNDEPRVKRLKAMAIEFQKNKHQTEVSNFVIDFGYNTHIHTSSCFKNNKRDKKKAFADNGGECRYRFPQRQKKKTVIQNVTDEPKPWYMWYGTYEMRHIKEICHKRKAYDAFQNMCCPVISHSKLTCNTNIAFIMPGPIGGYCFHYTMKGTQDDDTEPYAKVKASMEKILSEMKYEENDNQEAARRILYASFCHQADNSIRPTMAAYLLRNKSRFIFSHDIIWCPLMDLRLLTMGEDITVRVSFYKQSPFWQCNAMHYLCRPLSLENINPFQFYSEYEVLRYSKTVMETRRGSRLIETNHFRHPSFNENEKVCDQIVVKRYNKVLLQIYQYTFSDAANFECNILLDELPISDEIEEYSHMVLLLFCPYRCSNDLKINDSYNKRLRQLINSHQLCKMHCDVLQNIQDCKSNDFRFTITNDDLDRATEPFHTPRNANEMPGDHDILELAEVTSDYNPTDDFDIADLLLINDQETSLEEFDMTNTEDLDFDINKIRDKSGPICGYQCLPILTGHEANDESYLQLNNFIQVSRQPNDSRIRQPDDLQEIEMTVDKMFVIMNFPHDYRLSLNEIIGSNENVDVQPANGKAESIVNWASKCKLDDKQKQAFEVITGYYILSYVYSITDFRSHHYQSDYVIREKEKLELLVGKEKIRNTQLICFLHGPGGSGKSTVIALVQCYSKAYHQLLQSESYNRSIVITAMTGVAATIIGGETVHSALHINTQLNKIAHEKRALWRNTKLLIIDEISFASDVIIRKINRRLIRLNDNINPFGGIHVIFCGDLRQLEPVGGHPLYYKHNVNPSVFKSHINCYIELNGMHRFSLDTNWGQILLRFRKGKPTKEDIKSINTKVEFVKKGVVNNIPFDIKYATFTNRDRDSINVGIFQQKLDYFHSKFKHTNNFIMIFSDELKVKKNNKYIPICNKKYFYENFGEADIIPGRSGRIDPVLKLYIGCDVMLTENVDVINSLANGTRATVESIFINADSTYKTIKLKDNKIVRAVYASDVDYILLRHKNLNVQNLTFQVKPKVLTFTVSMPNENAKESFESFVKFEKLSMKAQQFPIIVNNATTGHKLQGVGVDKLFVHAWQYKRNWPYVVLSRVKQFSGLFLRSPLDTNVRKYMMPDDLKSLITFFERYEPDNIDRDNILR